AREFEDYLKCGRLEHGFLRVRCQSCHHEKLVAFSCKRRGFCPSCGVRRMVDSAALLVIDELHNVLAGNSVNRREFLNLLRFLGNELRIPLVGVGTRDAYLAIRSDDQLENRFEPMMLPVWEANDDCCSLLASFAASLPLRRPSPIATLDMARYLLTRSEGTIGELAHLLMAAAIVAVESGEEAINHRTLSMAC
ncbi:TPA: TniB family NTP-binding protein, partial [Escherichia coli]|nr:TniB family NTP-binding protein [Escherichia coli]HEI1813915.1 TniB family NTP-binding protein [Escherichia coli]